jgi:LCP family protein required for cell wall assembly
MQTGNYFSDQQEIEIPDENENTNRLEVALFKYIEFMEKSQDADKEISLSKKFLAAIQSATEITAALKVKGLSFAPAVENEEAITLAVTSPQYGDIFTYKIDKETGTLYLITPYGEQKGKAKTSDEFKSDVSEFIKDNVAGMVSAIKDFKNQKNQLEANFALPTVKAALDKLQVRINTTPSTTKDALIYEVLNQADETVGKITLTKSAAITFEDVNNPDLKISSSKLPDSLLSFLNKLDARTKLQRKYEESKISIENTLNDSGFKSLLKSAGVKFAEKPREDKDRIYFDILNSEATVVSSIVIEKATGIVNIVQPNGTNSENLLFFDPEFKKKTLEIPSDIPDYGDTLSNGNGKIHILLGGRQGSNVDTIILVQLDEKTKKARMVSIPRDLFYNGRKINAYWTVYGMKEFAKSIQDISGYKIDKYVLVDMYAFIDIVDLIGGIDIHLDKALTDPNYRVVNNGVEGTLHYEPGDYHMNGIESLRIARSRKTTSDFSRAERQQMILKAIQEKAKGLGLVDISTIYEIAKVVLKKVETNVSFDDAIGYYFKYKDYEIESNAVMSTSNILFSPPYQPIEDCQKAINDAAAGGGDSTGEGGAASCLDDNHAYTLLPQDENWNVIKWYFRQQFE